jgi:hypothetical protein
VEKMLKKSTTSRKQIHVFLVTMLIVGISLSVFLSIGLSANTSIPLQEPDAEQDMPASNEVADDNNDIDEIDFAPETGSNVSSLMTEKEALELAVPLIEKYANENGRTITEVKATFNSDLRDLMGFRGGPSLGELLENPNLQAQSYPKWLIIAAFAKLDIEYNPQSGGEASSNPQYWIDGFEVSIWADTGEVYWAVPRGHY